MAIYEVRVVKPRLGRHRRRRAKTQTGTRSGNRRKRGEEKRERKRITRSLYGPREAKVRRGAGGQEGGG